MHRLPLCLLTTLISLISISQAEAQIHPKEVLGRRIFDAFRLNKFSDFYLRSIFSLEEDQFRELLFGIQNHELRQNLLHFYTLDYPPSAQTELAKWRVAFAHTWEISGDISRIIPRMVQRDAFDPIPGSQRVWCPVGDHSSPRHWGPAGCSMERQSLWGKARYDAWS